MLDPILLKAWVEEHRDALKPPVGNKILFPSDDYIIMAVGGPNQRDDFHVNQGEEIFYQIEGDIQLNVMEEGQCKTVDIRQGELFLLPSNTPHSPQRPKNSIGIVIEKIREHDELDGFQWYCHECNEKMYEEFANIIDIVKQLPEIFSHFYDNPEHATCQKCGWVATRDKTRNDQHDA